jgi:Na+/proline symporter
VPPRHPHPSQNQRAFAARTQRTLRRRRVINTAMIVVLGGAAVLATLPLLFILFHLIREGASALSLDFFTRMPMPVGEAGGGLANAIVGTLILVGVAAAASARACTSPRTAARDWRTSCDSCPMSSTVSRRS